MLMTNDASDEEYSNGILLVVAGLVDEGKQLKVCDREPCEKGFFSLFSGSVDDTID